MAEVVEQVMESMVPCLDDLRRKRIFQDSEIRQIVKRRRTFEYTLIKPQPTPLDYLNYIRYELALECLRRRRSYALNWKSKSLSDHAGVRHLCSIFERCLKKHKHDTRMWYQFIDFCLRSGTTRKLPYVLMNAVKFHPREVHFWLLAADRELKSGHIQAARTLLMRGLRCMPHSAKLWSEFFHLEVQVARYVLALRSYEAEGRKQELIGAEAAAAKAVPAAAAAPEEAPKEAAAVAAEAAIDSEAAAAAPEQAAAASVEAAAVAELGVPKVEREEVWEPARTLLRRALQRLSNAPRASATFLSAATDCIRSLYHAAEGASVELTQELLAAIAQRRPGITEHAKWRSVAGDTAVALWQLWWSVERATAASSWRSVVKDVVQFAPPEVLQHCADVLAGTIASTEGDEDPQAALLEVARAPRVVDDAETALAVLGAIERCRGSGESSPLGAVARDLLQRASYAHPTCARLVVLAGVRDSQNIAVALRGTSNIQPACGAQLFLLALDSEATVQRRASLLEAVFRALAEGSNPLAVVEAFLSWALTCRAMPLPEASQEVFAVATRLWDAPVLRAQVLAASLEAELRMCGAMTGESAQRLCSRHEEVLEAFGRVRQGAHVMEWWLRYGEFVARATLWGCGEHVPRAVDLHWRAMRAVDDQASYAEEAQQRLQLTGA